MNYSLLALRWAVPPSPLHILNVRLALRLVRGGDGKGMRVLAGQAMVGVHIVIVGMAVAELGWQTVALAWLVPILVVFPFIAYLTAVPEHFGLGHPSSQMSGTRTVFTNGWFQWLLWNFNHHTAHHTDPRIPFDLLPAATRHMQDLDLAFPTEDGYFRFHASLLHTLTGETGRADDSSSGMRHRR